jgi:uncharacterized ferritin-like protein (DUF455 family)
MSIFMQCEYNECKQSSGSACDMSSPAEVTLRFAALQPLVCADADKKAALALAIDVAVPVGGEFVIAEPPGIPGRPARPPLVAASKLKQRDVRDRKGRAALIHALTHIELNAIDLALDLVWRFEGMPEAFYTQWVQVAKEEALHFQLLRDHLATLGHAYGDFPAHGALWEMAERTKDDLLARLALVPRTLEARGLDASPPIKAKLQAAGDSAAAAILDVILRDEIGHVHVGNHWFNYLCRQRDLDPITTYRELADRYRAPRLRGPFNVQARLSAGFTAEEMAELERDVNRDPGA